jgi:chromate reductase
MASELFMKVLVFGASLRKGSWNKKVAAQAARAARDLGHEADHADFRDFEMPVYDGDLEDASGTPPGAMKLVQRIRNADALIISTPEYNGSIPGAFKNAIDWVSREEPMPWAGKPILLLAASPGALGGVRSLWHSRQPLEVCGAYVYPEVLGVSRAAQAFNDDGSFVEPKQWVRLQGLVRGYLGWADRLRTG